MDDDTLIETDKVSLSFGHRQVLDQVSLKLCRRQVVTLIGPNGAGKTSLVRIILGLLQPQSGTVRRKPWLRIGYMPQKLHIEPTLPLTVRRFLQLANPHWIRRTEALPQHVLEEVVHGMRIDHLLEQQLGGLSGGEMQRVLLARALSQRPQLLVLDEPAQGVDVGGQAELYDLINTLRHQHDCGVLMISHDLHLVMANTDEVVCLNHHICCQGRPEQVSTHPSYLEMFGRKEAETLAVYTHHHNHRHGIAGEVIDKKDG